MLSRIFVLFPLVLSLATFILTFLALFAGHKDGFMEDYAIARVTTSSIYFASCANIIAVEHVNAGTKHA